MDYKKIIKSRKTRLAILRFLRFLPDKTMLRWQYFIKMGRRLHLKNPQRYTEKLQWYKLYYHNPEMIRCVDKYDVRSYVEEKGLGALLNTCYGVYETAEAVDFAKLPSQFVLKDTLSGGGNSVVIVTDKASADLDAIRERLRKWVASPLVKSGGREWPYYSGKKHRILAERYIRPDAEEDGLTDYKFFCFQGKVEWIQVMGNRKLGESVRCSLFDRAFEPIPVRIPEDPPLEKWEKPENFAEMVRIAELLAAEFPHVRVDMYNVRGQILFGELTFFSASGYCIYEPDTWDYTMGEKFELSRLL